MKIEPHGFWQELHAKGSLQQGVQPGAKAFCAALPDGRQVVLPVRVLPGDGQLAVASMIINQASFEVLDAFAQAVADQLDQYAPEIVVGVPTLGLPLAERVARLLGHTRMVALGTSRKFWYDDGLSQPLSSITTPGQGKRLYLDPRMRAVLDGRRIAVVDDVLSTGSSIAAVLRLLDTAGYRPTVIGAAMLQSDRWRGGAGDTPVCGAISTPILQRAGDTWVPVTTPRDGFRPSPR